MSEKYRKRLKEEEKYSNDENHGSRRTSKRHEERSRSRRESHRGHRNRSRSEEHRHCRRRKSRSLRKSTQDHNNRSRRQTKDKHQIKKDNCQPKDDKEEIYSDSPIVEVFQETSDDMEQQRIARLRRLKKATQKFQQESEYSARHCKFEEEAPQTKLNVKDRISDQERQKMFKYINEEREKNMQETIIINKQSTAGNLLTTENDSANTPDMFVATPTDAIQLRRHQLNIPLAENENALGYYMPTMGEVLRERYRIIGICGKGIYSTVVKVADGVSKKEYAVKIVRSLDVMIMSGEKEKNLFKKLNEIDKQDQSHIIRLLDSFYHKKHLCMVFELLDVNLRELLKQNKDKGLPLEQVRKFAKQLLLAFVLIHKYKIIHTDFKPDNTLVSHDHKKLKLCDLGSAIQEEEAIITSELVSRFYRPPEIFLGCLYDTKLDIWSLGCTLYELYTGKILFSGRNNNEMLKMIMELNGKVSQKVLKRGSFTSTYFNEAGDFLSLEVDPYTRQEYVKELNINHYPTKDLMTLLRQEKKRDASENNLAVFKNFLDKCLHIDSHKRLSSLELLCHEFIGMSPSSVN